MSVGPVQLVVLGFDSPDFQGEIKAELERLRESNTIKVIDSMAVYKDSDGDIEVEFLSNLSDDEAEEIGSKVANLVGLGFAGEEGMELGAEAAAESLDFFDEDDRWDVVEEIPLDSAAVLILIEHHWAVGLRDAVARAGGFRLGDTFISPLDLVAVGLMSRADAESLV